VEPDGRSPDVWTKETEHDREELRRALADAPEGDPISWLEQRIADSARKGVAGVERDEIVESLRRVFGEANKRGKSSRRAGAGP
jgi:hypothetical protein